MMNNGEDIDLSGSRSPSSVNNDAFDMDESNDDNDRSTQQANGDDETDTSDDTTNFVTDVTSSTMAPIPVVPVPVPVPVPVQQKRLVLSKKIRISISHHPSTSTSSSMNVGNAIAASPTKSRATTKASPIRIKLSLRKLPVSTNNKNKLLDENTDNKSNGTSKVNDHHADDDDENVSEVVNDKKTIVPPKSSSKTDSPIADKTLAATTKPPVQKSIPAISKTATGSTSKRRSLLPSKQVRIPPLTSPGLCMLRPPIALPPPPAAPPAAPPPPPAAAAAPAAGVASNTTTTTTTKPTYYSPQQVFDVVMSGAGYTYEQRTDHPHRGSSVQRTIGDMYDTSINLSLHPIELVPKDLWNYVPTSSNHSSSVEILDSAGNQQDGESLQHLLIRALDRSKTIEYQNRKQTSDTLPVVESRKRPHRSIEPMKFREMVPVSLTIPYPDSYVQKRIEYVNKVKEREAAIIQWQDAQVEIEMLGEDIDNIDANTGLPKSTQNSSVNPVTVPPIPPPPDPPKLNDLCIPSDKDTLAVYRQLNLVTPYLDGDINDHSMKSNDESTHPIYLPRSKEDLLAHLDPNCFHITDGRYFGLQTNRIADPNFIGPNTPGLTSLTNTGGLATATTSTTTSTSGLTGGGMTMIFSASYHSAAAVAPKDENSNITATSNKVPQLSQADAVADIPKSESTGSSPKVVPTLSSVGLPLSEKISESQEMISKSPTTRTLSDLRKIMEGNDTELLQSFRECIVRAIVYTYRSQKPCNIPFHGPDHDTYPDIGKAFVWFGGIKPCDRCKGNKQGVLHCRIRRRHDEPDYDGGHTSVPLLRPLMDAPIETVLL